MKKLLLLGLLLVGFQAKAESCKSKDFEYIYGTPITVTSGFYLGQLGWVTGYACVSGERMYSLSTVHSELVPASLLQKRSNQ